ncbi:MAG: hypothetical protein F6K40_39780 [Okeania sp. SIO3I5]|uniref:hypothetical protein n=1 Tax=Okeania sp. SIO3I5 TaxID=2607805 RepID=UPI0013B88CB4|nr:hypothetical protein [Okeania sp. SIO3I5]NEQ41994.1 hypothetical protein [Okeania sp. SIO3I5]
MEKQILTDINTLTIYELRRAVRRAVRRAGLGEDDIRRFGDLRRKRTWRLADREFCTPGLSDSDRDLLFGEVEFKRNLSGHLLLEYDNYFEPPDPDDFPVLDDFCCQFRRWEQDFPAHAAALR